MLTSKSEVLLLIVIVSDQLNWGLQFY